MERCTETIGGLRCVRVAHVHTRFDKPVLHRTKNGWTFASVAERAAKLGIIAPADAIVIPSRGARR